MRDNYRVKRAIATSLATLALLLTALLVAGYFTSDPDRDGVPGVDILKLLNR